MAFDLQQGTLYIQDVTLRDGMHAIRHQYGVEHVQKIAKALDEAVADVCQNAVLTTLLLPGIGTVEDLKHAFSLGVRSVRIATH